MTCLVCGCTEFAPCFDEAGETCAWVEIAPRVMALDGYGLCTFCCEAFIESEGVTSDDLLPTMSAALERSARLGMIKHEPLVEIVSEAEADSFLRTRRLGV